MIDLRILWLTDKGDGYVGAPQTQYGFEQAVAEKCECKFAGPGWEDYVPNEPLVETVRRVMPDCDWVIDRDNNMHVGKPTPRRYKIGHFISDIHAKHYYGVSSPVAYAQMINQSGYDAVFLRYKELHGTKYRPDAFWDWIQCDKHWVPWSVDDKFYSPKPKNIDVAFLGSIGNCYPLRNEIWDSLYYVVRGYHVLREEAPRGKTYERSVESLKEGYYVGEKYRDALAETRNLIFGCSIYKYPLQKFFEGMASKCLVLCNAPSNAKQLGFINGETYVEIYEGDWEKTLTYILENPKVGDRIRRNGLKNVLMNHTHDKRAQEFIKVLSQ